MTVSQELKRQIDRWADAWLKAKFERLLELRALNPAPFNHPIAVVAEWRGVGRWFTTHRGLTAAQCVHEIETNEVFWPVT